MTISLLVGLLIYTLVVLEQEVLTAYATLVILVKQLVLKKLLSGLQVIGLLILPLQEPKQPLLFGQIVILP